MECLSGEPMSDDELVVGVVVAAVIRRWFRILLMSAVLLVENVTVPFVPQTLK